MTHRYNTFNQVHKGLRAYMFDTALRLQQTELSGDEASLKIMADVAQLIDSFESHAQHEDNFINEPLEAVDPEVAHLFEKEHEEDHRLGIVLRNLLEEWHGAESDDRKISIGCQLQFAFHEFVAFNLYHMNKEEIELNKVLWRHYSDQEILATEQRIVQSVPPQKLMGNMKWMVRGINDSELVRWMNNVKLNAPSQVYAILISIAEHELEPSRWSRIERSLHQIMRQSLETPN